jgi:hypothetical protein
MAKDTHYTVLDSFITTHDGEELEYHKGDVVEAEDPIFKKHPHLFAPLILREDRARAVEQATAAPGEKRATGKPITTASIKGR